MLSDMLNNYYVKQYDIINSVSSKPNMENIINKFPIYVINLKEDKTRRNYIKMLFMKYKINYSLIMVDKYKLKITENTRSKINTNAPILGCILSHLWCIKHAISKNYERFIIFEDDIIFHKNFDYMFKQILESHIENIDLLMLGALDKDLNKNLVNFKNTDLIYYPTTNILGAHANIYKLEFAKTFLNYKLTSNKILEFDYDYKIFMHKFKIGVCMPNLVVCELSTSNIGHYFFPLYPRHVSYKKWFHVNFTYDDYEYIIILFINFIKDKIEDCGYVFNNLQEMLDEFSVKYKISRDNYIYKSMLNSGYTKNDILEIISYINEDKY